jgi:hypothetical protein
VIRHSRWIILLAVIAASAILPAEASAQRRVAVRRPAVRSVVYVSARPYYRPFYYSPFFYGGYGGWYSGYGWYPYYWGQPYPYRRYYADYSGAARLQVQPRDAQVYIDGYFVGTVDDFDGWLQRLHVDPGEHDLAVYRPGYRTYRQQVLFRPGATIKIEHVMQPLAPGDPEEPRPMPAPSASQPPRRNDPMPPRRAPAPPRAGESPDYGAIAVRVQPADAEVLVDGERWQSPEAGDLTLQLTEGTHRVEIRREGYRSYSAEIRVKRGETSSLNVSLSRQ